MGCLKCVTLSVVVVSVVAFYFVSFKQDLPPLEVKDEWWGKEFKPEQLDKKTNPVKFEVSVKSSEIEDLKSRLQKTRLVEPLDDVNFEYGMNTKYLKTVLDYWINKYDWNKEQARINSFPQFHMEIDGLKVHYVHVKPQVTNKRVLPLMLVHGWPGSVLEFYNAIPILTAPQPDRDFVFEVICPHIPGYGFSEAPHRSGFNQAQAAKIFTKLMNRLGFQKYYLQGGDWGSVITTVMSMLEPERVLGLHLNMLGVGDNLWNFVKWSIGSLIPQLAPGQDIGVHKRLYPMSKLMGILLQETGYLHIQATKPDTVGVGLSNSPAGLAAYILEKFSSWTEYDKSLQSKDGGLPGDFNLDELISNVMIYWINNAITPSVRFYKEAFSSSFNDLQITKRTVKPSTGLLICQNEVISAFFAFGQGMHPNVLNIDKKKCGHFAAMEKPLIFSKSVIKFVTKAEEQKKQLEKKSEKQN